MSRKQPVLTWPRFAPRDWSTIDRRLGIPSDEQLRVFAEQVDRQHHGKSSTVALAPNYRLRGLWCERHFARMMQLPMPLVLNPRGNRRQGFRLDDGTTIDVIGRAPAKSTVYPDLTRRADVNHRVDALVLVCFNGWESEPEVIGWVPEMYAMTAGSLVELKQADGRVVHNYLLSWRKLRSISELAEKHSPAHPLAGSDWRPFYWTDGVTTFAAETVVTDDDAPTQTDLFGMLR